jgi:hypothetical protein
VKQREDGVRRDILAVPYHINDAEFANYVYRIWRELMGLEVKGNGEVELEVEKQQQSQSQLKSQSKARRLSLVDEPNNVLIISVPNDSNGVENRRKHASESFVSDLHDNNNNNNNSNSNSNANFDKRTLMKKFRAQVHVRGMPIVGGGAGTGLSAKCEEAGGIDLMVC